MGKTKFYAVAAGRVPGVYEDWATCEQQVKGFRGARFKSFPTRQEAEAFVAQGTRGNGNQAAAAPAPAGPTAAAIKQEDGHDNKKRKLEPPREPKHWLVRVYFDGGSRGNPGLAGSGAEVILLENTTAIPTTNSNNGANNHPASPVITKILEERKKIHLRKFVGTNATNNQAEYQGLLVGVQRARREIVKLMTETTGHYLWIISLEIRGDSELIIRQLQGEYQCRHPQLIGYFQQVNQCVADLKRQENLQLQVTYDHVYREDNSRADALANEAMDTRISSETIFEADGTISNGPLS